LRSHGQQRGKAGGGRQTDKARARTFGGMATICANVTGTDNRLHSKSPRIAATAAASGAMALDCATRSDALDVFGTPLLNRHRQEKPDIVIIFFHRAG
jgi:hypothetical protein